MGKTLATARTISHGWVSQQGCRGRGSALPRKRRAPGRMRASRETWLVR